VRRQPLNERQLEILLWVADGYPTDRYEGDQHKQTARALENRRLVRVARKADVWTAELTEEGRFYLDHGRYDDPPPEPKPRAAGEALDSDLSPSESHGERITQRLLARQALRVGSGRSRARPSVREPDKRRKTKTAKSQSKPEPATTLEPMSMRYKIVVSRVQIAERHVRAIDEAAALEKVRAELEKPYGFLGGWTTVDTDLDIVEATNPMGGPPQQLVDKDAGFLLSIKAAAKYLGLSYSTLYDMVNTGELGHVVVGSRRYVSRDQMTAFIDSHSHQGGNYRLRGRGY
jgi:excisionase family DNA binding protein